MEHIEIGMYVVYAVVVVLSVVDDILTRKSLELGNVESNPFLRFVIELFGVWGMTAAKIAGIAALFFLEVPPPIVIAVGIALVWLISRNQRRIEEAERRILSKKRR